MKPVISALTFIDNISYVLCQVTWQMSSSSRRIDFSMKKNFVSLKTVHTTANSNDVTVFIVAGKSYQRQLYCINTAEYTTPGNSCSRICCPAVLTCNFHASLCFWTVRAYLTWYVYLKHFSATRPISLTQVCTLLLDFHHFPRIHLSANERDWEEYIGDETLTLLDEPSLRSCLPALSLQFTPSSNRITTNYNKSKVLMSGQSL